MPDSYPVHGWNKPIRASQVMLVAGVDKSGNLKFLADQALGVQTAITGHFPLENPTTIRSGSESLAGVPVVIDLTSLYSSTPARVIVFNASDNNISVELTDLVSSAPAVVNTLMGWAVLDRGITNGFGSLTLNGIGDVCYEVFFT